MPLTRTYFNVFLDDPEDPWGNLEHRVEIRGADQLRAELEGKRRGLVIKDAMHTTYLWAWAALVRTGAYDGTFDEFKDVVIDVKPEKDNDPETVDPTQPAASAG